MAASYVDQTIWSSSPTDLGLTQEQWDFEQKWLKEFNDATDGLDWEQWKDFWHEDSFFKFCSSTRVEGKVAIAKYFKEYFLGYKSMKHEATRHSFDVPRGIIYQSLIVSSVVKGDSGDRALTVQGVNLIYKPVGESQIRGLEVYADVSPIADWIKEVTSGMNS
ncbi:hypothetical protein FRC08_001108 [Ceratobasidium sp. 394]|nr:hypothetical protein FRC08_001108 [Ceratobasidium sp. 394]